MQLTCFLVATPQYFGHRLECCRLFLNRYLKVGIGKNALRRGLEHFGSFAHVVHQILWPPRTTETG